MRFIPCPVCGSEYGETWHKAGMLANKQTVFNDFQAAAEYLIEHKYTSPSRCVCVCVCANDEFG